MTALLVTRLGARFRAGAVLEPLLPATEVVVLSEDPVLLVTRRVAGGPLSWEWASGMSSRETTEVAHQIAAFLVRLHGTDVARVVGGLPEVHPTAQADTERLRGRFPRLVDDGRAASVMRWCDWVDRVLDGGPAVPEVLVHGDLHGYNQVWDQASASLLAVVDFEESGDADRHFDLRYLPNNARGPPLVLAVLAAYEQLSGQRLGSCADECHGYAIPVVLAAVLVPAGSVALLVAAIRWKLHRHSTTHDR